MSRPLVADGKRKSEAHTFHRRVFAKHGKACYFCGSAATDAAHVIGRAHLGPLRYADPHFARPTCRRCHDAVDRNEIKWPIAILRDAVKHFNKLAKVPMVMP